MFVKVTLDELAPDVALAYDVYSLEGELMFPVGTTLGEEEVMRMRHVNLYRNTEALPLHDFINHEGRIIEFEAGLTEQERCDLEAETASEPLLDIGASDSCVGAIAIFLERLQKGATPDIALCEVTRDRLIAQVTDKVDQIQYLSQVRVRDEVTYSHILDVTALSIALAVKAGFSKKEVQEIALSAILHDLGKLMIPKQIMFKPSRLTEKEFQVMKLHPELGYKIIVEDLKLPEHIARPALEHQEMYGGGGYPLGLKGDEIHPYSHVVKIADVYDALTSKRPYKESIPSSKAIKIMLSEGDKSFHPELFAQFLQLSNYHDFSRERSFSPREMAS